MFCFVVGRAAGWGTFSMAGESLALGVRATAGCGCGDAGTSTVVGRVSSETTIESVGMTTISAGAGSAGVGEEAT